VGGRRRLSAGAPRPWAGTPARAGLPACVQRPRRAKREETPCPGAAPSIWSTRDVDEATGTADRTALSARAMGGIRGETAHQTGFLEVPFQGVALAG
jgi:hypothetical protein